MKYIERYGYNIVDWILDQKLADNRFRAAKIANGLKLAGVDRAEQEKRVRLYRDWRKSGVFGWDTKACYEKAIAGEAVPMLPVEAK